MRIATGTVATFEYTVTDEQGNLIDTSRTSGPFSYVHGKGTIVPGLELAMEGRSAGESFSVTLPPPQAYGQRDENLVHILSRKDLARLGELKPGMRLQTPEGSGKRILTVSKIEGDRVILDENHPLAGKTVRFDISILAVRPATAEEMETGRAYNAACREDCSVCPAYRVGLDHDCGCGCDHHAHPHP